jgi:membrane protease YdiL (CAAX protease family)
MIHGYRMAGPPPHGEPPPPPSGERDWPVWLGFATFFVAFIVANVGYAVVLGISGADVKDTPAWVDLSSAVFLEASLVGCAIGAAAMFKPLRASEFGLRRTRFWPALGWAALAMAAFYLFAILWTALVGEPKQTTANDIGANESELALLAAGVLFVVLAPIAEEFFFRGFFYATLRTKLPVAWAAIVNGAIFGAIHASTGASAVPVLIFLGIALCLVRERTGSLYPCIAIHAFNNMLAYAALTKVAPGVAIGMGGAMLVACTIAPRLIGRESAAA